MSHELLRVELLVLVHHTYLKHPVEETMSRAHEQAYQTLEHLGLLVCTKEGDEETLSEFTATEKGQVYVDAMRRLPMPTQKWSME